jgi:hypothetical protein
MNQLKAGNKPVAGQQGINGNRLKTVQTNLLMS